LKAILYVKSVKTVIGVDDRSHEGYVVQNMGGTRYGGPPPRLIPDYKVDIETVYKNILPEDQKAVVEMVKAAAVKHGFALTVIDVTKEGSLHRLEERLKGIRTFPALVADTGQRFEGQMTGEKVESFLSQIANQRQKKYL
jgi:hypothetical protein